MFAIIDLVVKFLEEVIQLGLGAIAIAVVGTVLGGWVGFLIGRRLLKKSRKRVKDLEDQLRTARDELRVANQKVGRLETEKKSLETDKKRLEEEKVQLTGERDKAIKDGPAKDEKYQNLRTKHADLVNRWNGLVREVTKLVSQRSRIKNIGDRLWDAPIHNAPEFRPLTPKAAPIIAVLNLKGGVGKTTLTGNLGGSLAAGGSQVLLVDLDYQGSLSSLYLEDDALKMIRLEHQMLQHYFLSPDPVPAGFQNCVVRNPKINCDMVTCADELDEVERKLLNQWLLEPEPDVRFLLRKALHAPAIQQKYDYILLDCPPRYTTACVNALACCDYVLLPVSLDQLAWLAVPRLLKMLKKLKTDWLPNLSVLGVVVNRTTQQTGLVEREKEVWKKLQDRCNDVWKEPVHLFKASIPQTVDFAKAANERQLALKSPVVKRAFAELAKDIKERITHESGRLAGVSH